MSLTFRGKRSFCDVLCSRKKEKKNLDGKDQFVKNRSVKKLKCSTQSENLKKII